MNLWGYLLPKLFLSVANCGIACSNGIDEAVEQFKRAALPQGEQTLLAQSQTRSQERAVAQKKRSLIHNGRSVVCVQTRHDLFRLTQKEAAQPLNTEQPRISDILQGRVCGFSIERLLSYVTLLVCDVQIQIVPRAIDTKRTNLTESKRGKMHAQVRSVDLKLRCGSL